MKPEAGNGIRPVNGRGPVSRRQLLGACMIGLGGVATKITPASAGATGAKIFPRASGGERVGPVSIAEFGAVGDGRSDDRAAIQAAVDWAARYPGTALHVPARIFGLRGPVLIPGEIELAGEVPGAGNHPVCGFRALKGFRSELVQRYQMNGTIRSLNVAALLVSREWAANVDFARRLHLRDLFFDVDGITDGRGAAMHGLLLSNQQLDIDNVWVRHPTGYGVWINTQLPNGEFVRPIVDNVLRRVWVRGAGVGNATYVTDHGTHHYGGFLIGALPGSRNPAGDAEPAIATDGVLDYCTVASGPEEGLGCRGHGIHITQAGGWRVAGCHLNGAGRHGIALDKAYQTEISGCYIDGWGADADAYEGDFGGIWCRRVISLGEGAEGGVIVVANRLKARASRSVLGNRFAAIGMTAGSTGEPRGVIIGNVITRRRHAAPSAAFHFGRARAGQLEAVVTGNAISGTPSLFMRRWDDAVVRLRFEGNNFQHADAPPRRGWHPSGLRIENASPRPGAWSCWINVAAGSPGTWRGAGRIDA